MKNLIRKFTFLIENILTTTNINITRKWIIDKIQTYFYYYQKSSSKIYFSNGKYTYYY